MMKWKFLSGSVAPTIYDGNHKPVGGDSNGQHDGSIRSHAYCSPAPVITFVTRVLVPTFWTI